MAEAINLTSTDFRTQSYEVPQGAFKASIQVHPDSTNGWGTAVVTVEYKVDDGTLENTPTWQGFESAVTLSSSTPSQRKVSVTGATHISLRTSTADGDADANAEYVVAFS